MTSPKELSTGILRFLGRPDREPSPERHEVSRIRRVRSEDLNQILRWFANPQSSAHIDPVPELPQNWNDNTQVFEALRKLEAYYRNIEDGEESPNKILPIVAINAFNEPIGANTLRWRGDKYAPVGRRIASLERMIVNPDLQEHGVGTTLLIADHIIAFDLYRGYNGRGASELRAWVMTDRAAGNYSRNINFLRKLNWSPVPGEKVMWSDFAEMRGIHTDREAMWWFGKQEDWEEFKTDNRELVTSVRNKIAPLDLPIM